jgi:hypothetical protein
MLTCENAWWARQVSNLRPLPCERIAWCNQDSAPPYVTARSASSEVMLRVVPCCVVVARTAPLLTSC